MRQIQVQVPRAEAREVVEAARQHEAVSTLVVDGRRADGAEWALVTLSVRNDRVGALISAVAERVERAEFVLEPQGALPLSTPLGEVESHVRKVQHLSTLELVAASLQSVGSWRGMLLYALFSGVIAAYASILDVTYLLVGAMLVAPMGAPAMVSVVGVAVGDWRMVGRGAARFAASIAVLVVTAAALGLAYGLDFSTATMEQVTALSSWGVLLALVAGAAGAQSQVQSSRASLVSGTAAGFLVAAALSPTSAVLGLALVLGRWEYVSLMAFQLALQYAAIVTGGSLALRLFGVRPGDATLGRGSARWRGLLAAAGVLAGALLVGWQASRGVSYRKADSSRELMQAAKEAVRGVEGVRLIEVDARFTRDDLTAGRAETALIDVVAERRAPALDAAAAERATRDSVQARVRRRMPDVVPYVVVTLLPPDSARP